VGALELCAALLLDGSGVRADGLCRLEEPLHLPLGQDAWLLALDADLSTPLGEGWLRVLAPASLRLALPALALEPLLARAARLDPARATLRIEAARTPVPRATLATLEPGDVLVFEGARRDALRAGRVRLRLGRAELQARLEGLTLKTESPFQLKGSTRMDPRSEGPESAEPAGHGADKGALLGELPVEVACEIGRVTLTGRELLELVPGAVIPVGRPLAGPVDLVVGDRVIARGELVDVEGELGVRLLEMLA
jgi:type III secretion protein Q